MFLPVDCLLKDLADDLGIPQGFSRLSVQKQAGRRMMMGGKRRFEVRQWFVGSTVKRMQSKVVDLGYPIRSGYGAKTCPTTHGLVDGQGQRLVAVDGELVEYS
jgi:hypothetical protein